MPTKTISKKKQKEIAEREELKAIRQEAESVLKSKFPTALTTYDAGLSKKARKFDDGGIGVIRTDASVGLTDIEVSERVAQGLVNSKETVNTRSVGKIVFSNVFTIFNLINFALFFSMIAVEAYTDSLFIGLVVSNTLINLYQELRSKKVIDNLSLLSATRATVLRNGVMVKEDITALVKDDVLLLTSGNEVPADSIVLDGEIEVNESLLTGESDLIPKVKGGTLMSGSFVVSGNAKVQITKVGRESYVSEITNKAKKHKGALSEIKSSVSGLVKVMTFMMFPIAAVLMYRYIALLDLDVSVGLPKAVAQILGMMPQGVVLLTTLVFATSVVRLALNKTLVQDLYSIETLARVDVICLDKTGTITSGLMHVEAVHPFEKNLGERDVEEILSALAGTIADGTPTFTALKERFHDDPHWAPDNIIPFSSSRKFSGVYYKNRELYLIGAGEFIMGDRFKPLKEEAEKYAAEGYRVLTLACSPDYAKDNKPPERIMPLAFVLISETLRDEAKSTLEFFESQNVAVKIISGDNPVTVSNVARRAGVADFANYVDASTLDTTEKLIDGADSYSIFGRVTPDQKLELVKALKAKKHVVAMTGDGVNDVMALREADCSIAMVSGADIVRNVSTLVLLDNNFANIPRIVGEGRRSINNLERSAALYMTKLLYSMMLAITFCFVSFIYPFYPIQLTLIGTVFITLPSLLWVFEANNKRIKGRFLKNMILPAVPGAICIALSLLTLQVLHAYYGWILNISALDEHQISTLACFILGFGLYVALIDASRPLSMFRFIMITAFGGTFVIAYTLFGSFFRFTDMTGDMLKILGMLFGITVGFLFVGKLVAWLLFGRRHKKELVE